jgi:hypothetical protein
MDSAEDWLPELVLFENSQGDWPRYVEVLHEHFLDDFVRSKPGWPGKRVALKRHPETDGKSATFWHFISEGDVEEDRIPDFRRCERIRWPRPVMDYFSNQQPAESDRILWWKEKRKSETRYVLTTEDFSYKVVVADRGDYVLPWTAYYLEYDNARRKLRQKFEGFWRAPW